MILRKFKVQSLKFKVFENSLFRLLFLSFTIHFSLFTAVCLAEEGTTIKSETLEYDGKTFTYDARGRVRIEKESAKIEADEMRYNEKTSDVFAEGDVLYDDSEVTVKAKKAELNLEFNTGRLYDAEVFSKKDNYHITGLEVEKKGEKEYTLKKASFTTCDAPLPAWCFRGSDVDVIVGDRMKARNVTFNIKGLPVLYSPYFQTSLSTERKTGFLTPSVGYIQSKGMHYEVPFYWAISENRDATFILDVYTKRGIGEGLEYRFLEPGGSRGNFWVYHVRDKELARDFWDLRGVYDNREGERKITGYLNLNYINSRDFYTEYSSYVITGIIGSIDPVSYLSMTTGRFYESNGEVSLKLDNSRVFLRAQYLIDLKGDIDQSTVPQRLPEIGYFVDPRRIGPLVFSLSSSISNFRRGEGAFGQRLDVFPRFAYSFGDSIVLTQTLGLRETAYFLSGSDEFGSSPHRESFDYTVIAFTRLSKKYGAFVHIVEPSLSYTFIPQAESDLPLFDSTELYNKTSTIELSILNRFMDGKGEFLTLRVAQPLDTYRDDRPLLPLRIEAALRRPLFIRGEASYDFNTGKVETINSDVGFGLAGASVSMGERYKRTEDILFYSVGIGYSFSKTLSAEGNFWYDARGEGLRDVIAKVKYQKQCWGVTMVYTKRQEDYSVSILLDLLGLGTIKLY